MSAPRQPSPDSIPIEVLDRYLAGEATPDEQRTAEIWTSQLHGDAHVLRGADGHVWDTDAAVRRLRDSVRDSVRDGSNGEVTGSRAAREAGNAIHRRNNRRDGWGTPGLYVRRGAFAVAALGVLAVVGLLGREGMLSRRFTPDALGARYATTTGQQAVVELTDGSKVTLAPQTTLQLDGEFGAEARTVTLKGEAYFAVAPGRRAPFIVRTGNVTTRVLGTEFDVRRYPGDKGVRVAVVSGKVAVSANTTRQPSLTLTAGVAGIVTDTSASSIDARSATAWLDGQLVFKEAPTTEVLAALTRWYGYRFRLTDSALAQKNLTVWISTKSSRDALATLRMTLDVDLAVDGGVVTLSPRRAAPVSRRQPSVFSPSKREVGR